MSAFGLGTMTFGAETDEPGAHEQLDRFTEPGGTLADTADVHGDGRSQEIIGEPGVQQRGRRLAGGA